MLACGNQGSIKYRDKAGCCAHTETAGWREGMRYCGSKDPASIRSFHSTPTTLLSRLCQFPAKTKEKGAFNYSCCCLLPESHSLFPLFLETCATLQVYTHSSSSLCVFHITHTYSFKDSVLVHDYIELRQWSNCFNAFSAFVLLLYTLVSFFRLFSLHPFDLRTATADFLLNSLV